MFKYTTLLSTLYLPTHWVLMYRCTCMYAHTYTHTHTCHMLCVRECDYLLGCLPQVVSSVRARFESKYQNSSTLAVSGSNSLLSRHRVAGRRGEERGDGSGQSLPQQGYSRDRHHHHQLRARFEARNHVVVQEELGDLNGVDCK